LASEPAANRDSSAELSSPSASMAASVRACCRLVMSRETVVSAATRKTMTEQTTMSATFSDDMPHWRWSPSVSSMTVWQ
jgi:hypothetical protein